MGSYAMDANTTGASNVGIGVHALGANTTADANIAIGEDALKTCTTSTSNQAIGTSALYSVTTGDGGNAVVGHQACYSATTAHSCVGIGKYAGYAVTTASNNIFIGKDSGRTGSPGGNITTASNLICLGDENIGTANIQVDWTVASDARDKTDVEPLKTGLSFINQLEPITYRWDKRSKYSDNQNVSPDGTHKEDWLDTGFLAQAVEKLEEEYGYQMSDKTNLTTTLSEDGKMYGLTYSKFVPSLVKAIQELSAEVEQLKQKAHDKCDNNNNGE